jgi:uncharacterized protein with FMN-binding domain
MRRAPIVLGGTLAGLVGVLTFHTTSARSTLPTAAGLPAASGPSAAGSANSAGSASSTGSAGPSPVPGTSAPASSAPAAAPSASTQQPVTTRSATGPQVNYNWGVLSVKVTVTGNKIVKVGIASLDDGGNPRSQFIDQQSIPLLEQQVMQAQSANIQGVSGASYTSAGFDQSLQGALQSLGFK